ncbi:hypothetical protein FisN_12Hh267 [Fistulifera solaris]|uniref:SGNH hydrolase-type esterase domain-containing protein n=1 Tax=Fistulifera solaris TaxID=1519565 RepID=A0A1Z5KBL9_FISSO|nr:hypothetical protein FisN_12Hh267 [Fistulifera solaris]|eukprot:GAX23690.1 hypothetical protein FisN_12Hh267 [Fistulifera solaris]
MNHPAFREALKSWSLGMAISIPTISILQGALLLYEYRRKHGDAPRPDVPCSGLVVVSSNPYDPDHSDNISSGKRDMLNLSFNNKAFKKAPDHRHEKPLRLLVIGDSLAAGVGIRESHAPLLPDSIAQVLSQAMNGRAVYWTCIGTPGIPSALLIEDIRKLGSHSSDAGDEEIGRSFPLVLNRLAQWQSESRERARKRLEAAQKSAEEWLEEFSRDQDESDKEDGANSRRYRRWIKRRIKQDLQRVLQRFRRMQQPMPPAEEFQKRRSLIRRTTLDPHVVGQYDIAVVLTGLNDIKDAFLPFMMSAERAREIRKAVESDPDDQLKGFKGTLIRIVSALQQKMGVKIPLPPILDVEDSQTQSEQIRHVLRKRLGEYSSYPLVVFPALPLIPIEPYQIAPLGWLFGFVFRRMDHVKYLMSRMYPDLVLFVDAPSKEEVAEIELGHGPLWDRFNKSVVLLQLNESSDAGRKSAVELLMRKHYHNWFLGAEEADELVFYELVDDEVEVSNYFNGNAASFGSSMVSCDGIHPSDHG